MEEQREKRLKAIGKAAQKLNKQIEKQQKGKIGVQKNGTIILPKKNLKNGL